MCLILDQRAGYTLPRHQLQTIITRNGDGFGAMWGDGKRLHLVRMVGDAAELAAAYGAHAGKRRVLHWRLGTHGRNDASMAHPFPLTDEVAVMHNGMLSCGTPDIGCSDTDHLARYVLQPIAERDPERLFSLAFAEVMAGLIGTGNKLALAHADGRVAIIGRSRGVDYAGCWWSNTYAWAPPAEVTGARTIGYARGGYAGGYAGGYGSSYTGSYQYGMDDDWTPAPSPSARSLPSPSAPAAVDTVRAVVTLPGRQSPASTLRAAAREGIDGVTQWIADKPADAALMLASWYNLDAEEAESLVAEDPVEAAGWLLELADAVDGDLLRVG